MRHPAALLLLLAVALFALRPHRAGRLASALRGGAYIALVLALAGVALTTRMPTDRLTVVAAIDTSPSIDPAGRAWAQRYLDADASSISAPGDELAVLTFGDRVELLRAPGSPTGVPDELPALTTPATDIGAALDSRHGAPARRRRRDGCCSSPTATRRAATAGARSRGCAQPGVRVDAAVPPHAASQRRARRAHRRTRHGRRRQPGAGARRRAQRRPAAPGGAQPLSRRRHRRQRRRRAAARPQRDDVRRRSSPARAATACAPSCAVEGDAAAGQQRAATSASPCATRTRVLVLTHATAFGRSPPPWRARTCAPTSLPPQRGARPRCAARLSSSSCSRTSPRRICRPPTLDVIERYVRDFGGGLLIVGGGATFGDAGFAKTPLKRLLPVTLEPHRPTPGMREPLALFLVIDRSNSMGYNSRIGTLRDGEKLRYAKEAALAVVAPAQGPGPRRRHRLRLAAARDRAAAAAAARIARTLEELHPAPGRERRHRLLRRAGLGARRSSPRRACSRRHIILLTDGDTNRAAPDEYRALIADDRRRQDQRHHHPHRRQHREPQAAAGHLAAAPAASSTTSRTPARCPI